MSDIAITVEGLGKAYHIGQKEEIPDSLVSAVSSWVKAPIRNFKNLKRLDTVKASKSESGDVFWALKDVSFEVKRGEVVGIIGRNGAGKSTLLKVLSRITEPTTGRAVIHGRVSSLLEVGTGFHPELSGRENVYMNGTILGMTKREIDRKFDEIVEFSGVEKFLDTPVKRYSSGMKVRLAFAVAAHLEPEILVIDEVLAVGDVEFQKKCIGKMQDVAGGGRTVLFVSHNMSAVEALCNRGVHVVKGKTKKYADPKQMIEAYLNSPNSEVPGAVQSISYSESCPVTIHFASIEEALGGPELVIDFELGQHLPMVGIGFEIRDENQGLIAHQGAIQSGAYSKLTLGRFRSVLKLKNVVEHLNSGAYSVNAWMSIPGSEQLVFIEPIGHLSPTAQDPSKSGKPLTFSHHGPLFVETSHCFLPSSEPHRPAPSAI